MKLSRFIKALALSVLVAACLIAATGSPPALADANYGKNSNKNKKLNVLLILTDDAGIDQLKLYGYGGNTAPPTPNLAALQHAGLTFRNAWTMPACSTGRGVLFTGRYPFRTMLQAALGPSDLANSMISPWERTLPKLMSSAGYATALFGKFHIGLQGNSPFKLDTPHVLGWDYYNGWPDETGDPSSIDTSAGLGPEYEGLYPNGYVPGSNVAHGADAGACYSADRSCRYLTSEVNSKNPAGRQCRDEGGIFLPAPACERPMPANIDFRTYSAHYVSPLVINEGGRVYSVPPFDKRARTFRNVQQTDAAIDWINKQKKRGKPWFATISTASVHTPMQVPPYNTVPPEAADPNGVTPSTTGGAIIIANQMIQAIDFEFGRLLKSTGLATEIDGRLVPTLDAANTVIVYVNDNGSLGTQVRAPFDPFRAKGTAYQTGVWTPMVVAGPIVKAPSEEVPAMVNIADLYELIGNIGGIDVHGKNPRAIDSVTMLPYFKDVNTPSIRQYNFTHVGPNIQANRGMNGPCQFSTGSCSQIPVTKSVCEDNGGFWFGEGNEGSYTTTDARDSSQTVTMPVPTEGFKYCCQVQKWVVDHNGVPFNVLPETSISVRDLSGYKLVRNEMNDYDVDTNSCVPNAQYNELYTVDEGDPPLIDRSNRLIPTPYTAEEQVKFDELTSYMDNTLASDPDCLKEGDGNDDGVVNVEDLKNYFRMVKLTKGSSWYDVNADGHTDSADRQIIVRHLGTKCK